MQVSDRQDDINLLGDVAKIHLCEIADLHYKAYIKGAKSNDAAYTENHLSLSILHFLRITRFYGQSAPEIEFFGATSFLLRQAEILT
jgi:hypothetical protein